MSGKVPVGEAWPARRRSGRLVGMWPTACADGEARTFRTTWGWWGRRGARGAHDAYAIAPIGVAFACASCALGLAGPSEMAEVVRNMRASDSLEQRFSPPRASWSPAPALRSCEPSRRAQLSGMGRPKASSVIAGAIGDGLAVRGEEASQARSAVEDWLRAIRLTAAQP